jgi:uncharacterized membrane protein
MDGIYNTLQMEEITDQYDPADMEQQKGMAIVSFLLCFLFFLPYISSKESVYAKAVANQCLTMFVGWIAIIIVTKIIGFIPLLGGLIGAVIWLAFSALIILKVIDAANNKLRKLPFGVNIEAFK